MSPKVWFITGSSTGFGRIMAQCALRNGDSVVATLRKPEALAELSGQYTPDRLLILKLDVTKPDDIVDAFAEAGNHFGRIDIVFNNAGTSVLGDVEGTPEEVARGLLDVLFWGAVNVSKEAVRFFRESNKPAGGRLLQNSSVLGFMGHPVVPYYVAAKFVYYPALEGFSESLAAELNPEWNVKITLIEPGYFQTNIADQGRMRRIPLHPAYAVPTSPIVAIYKHVDNNPPARGDAARAVEVIYRIAALPDPPLRFPLGKDCIEDVRSHTAKLLEVVDKYESWSEGLDAD